MSPRAIVFFVGLFIMLLPFAGFPQSWDTFFLVGAGTLLMLTAGFTLYRRSRSQYSLESAGEVGDAADEKSKSGGDAVFVENAAQVNTINSTPRTARIRTKVSRTVLKTPAVRKPRTPREAVIEGTPRRRVSSKKNEPME